MEASVATVCSMCEQVDADLIPLRERNEAAGLVRDYLIRRRVGELDFLEVRWVTKGRSRYLERDICLFSFSHVVMLPPGSQWWVMWTLGRVLCWECWRTESWTMAEVSLARSSSDTSTRWRAAGPAAWATTSWGSTRRDRWGGARADFRK